MHCAPGQKKWPLLWGVVGWGRLLGGLLFEEGGKEVTSNYLRQLNLGRELLSPDGCLLWKNELTNTGVTACNIDIRRQHGSS